MRLPLFVLFLLCWLSGFSQQGSHSDSPSNNEQIFIQLNSTFLITGETLYFKIVCLDGKSNKPTMLSKVAYLELIDDTARPVFQTKVSLLNGRGHGELFIPSTFSSGNYTLIGYTRWMRNFTTDAFFTKLITIVNPFKGSVTVTANDDNKISKDSLPMRLPSDEIKLKLPEKKFKTRAKVSLTLITKSMSSVYVSVRKKEAILDDSGGILNAVASPSSSQRNSSKLTGTKTYLPEMRGHLITGRLVPKGGVASRRNILVSIPGSDFLFRATTTDDHGNFNIIVDRIPESSTMLFQVMDDDIKSYDLRVDAQFVDDYSEFVPPPFSIDIGLRSIIDERNVFMQIENAYYETKKDSVPPTPSITFYNFPDKIYQLDDFTRFPTMEDIFREYIPEVVVKRSRDNFSLNVVSPRSGFPHSKEPLMLIDGVPILNTNTLMAYDPLKVDRIEIVRDKYVHGSLDFDGILSLMTYKAAMEELPSFNSHRESLVKIQSGKAYSFPDYSSDKLRLERIPDYRLQLYWNPLVDVTKGGSTTVDFYTSDVAGDFEIIVEGFSNDGELVSSREVFSVSK